MSRLYLLGVALLFALLPISGFAQIHISGPQTGVLVDTIYIVDGTINVPAGQTLVIQPGARLWFNPGIAFIVYGALMASGTQQDSIIFKRYNPALGWYNLAFQNSDSSTLEYCSISGANSSGIKIASSDLFISHCTIRNNSKNAPVGNGGGGIDMQMSRSLITDCAILHNFSTMSGGGICFEYSYCQVLNSVIAGNTTTYSGGGVANDLAAGHYIFKNCLIVENMAWALGGGFYMFNSSSAYDIVNCTIADNEAAAGCGSFWASWAPVRMLNCIIWYNTPPTYNNTQPRIQFSNLQTAYPGQGNLSLAPLFVPGPGGDYYLSQIAAGQTVTSPCVDAGASSWPMFPGTTRTDGVQDSAIVDMGYHYPVAGSWPLAAGLGSPSLEKEDGGDQITASPNPFNPTTAIRYQLPATSQVSLRVYDTAGRLISTLVDGVQAAGAHEVTFDGSKLPSGVYVYRLVAGGQALSGKMVLMK